MTVVVHTCTIFLALAIIALILQFPSLFDFNKLQGLKGQLTKIALTAALIFVLQCLSLFVYIKKRDKPHVAPQVHINYVQPNPVLQLGDDFVSEGEYESAIIKWFNEQYPPGDRY